MEERGCEAEVEEKEGERWKQWNKNTKKTKQKNRRTKDRNGIRRTEDRRKRGDKKKTKSPHLSLSFPPEISNILSDVKDSYESNQNSH